ncbi:MAG: hypothetical protein M9965_08040 [Anaerolineae bacterium]|nr:hypothetical protein [Anaerolineae bacterium]
MRKAQIFILVVVVLMAGAFFVPALAAEAMSACQIVNAASAEVFDNLQVAVDAANPGDLLTVTGTCVGTTMIDKDLVLEGDSAPESEQATLDGNGAGSVLSVAIDVNVTVTGLTITGGYSEFGGGIYNEGAMELNEVTVSDNASYYEGWLGGGGGIYNLDTMTLKNSAVTNNTAVSQGGGIYNKNGGKMNLNNSVVGGNLSTHINFGNGGGIYNDNYYAGTWIRLQNSIVVGNRAESLGGGISTYGFLMLSRSKVTNNTAGRSGGGVFTGAGTNTTIRTTMIRFNSASLNGGGIYAPLDG